MIGSGGRYKATTVSLLLRAHQGLAKLAASSLCHDIGEAIAPLGENRLSAGLSRNLKSRLSSSSSRSLLAVWRTAAGYRCLLSRFFKGCPLLAFVFLRDQNVFKSSSVNMLIFLKQRITRKQRASEAGQAER